MSRKNRDKRGESPRADASVEVLSRRGKKVVGAGAAAVALGFIVLSRADPMGRNWASVLSPFLILAGYAAIGCGIFAADEPSSEGPSSPQKTS